MTLLPDETNDSAEPGRNPAANAVETVDLNNCDREPIHIPGSIQPHGLLFALAEPELKIVQVSNNTARWLRRSPEDFLNQPLTCLLSDRAIHAVKQCLIGDFDHVNPLAVKIDTAEGKIEAQAIVHHAHTDIVILELEFDRVANPLAEIDYFNFYRQVKAPISAFQNAANFDDLCSKLVTSVRHITGFDRVMIYRFDPVGAGEVIAEACDPELEPYLGLRYPDTDIPQPARNLYTLNYIRSIPDLTYQPATLIPPLNPITQTPLDLSFAVLRSVSPMHIEYLHHMGVRASMSISLVRDGTLWGLIACHHREPKFVPYFLQTVCEFIGQVAIFELTAKADLQDRDYQIQIDRHKAAFFQAISQHTDVLTALVRSPIDLLKLVGATGVAIFYQDEWVTFGHTPDRQDLSSLLTALLPRLKSTEIFQTVCLSQEYPAAAAYSEIASGLLAMTLSSAENFYILWLRSEVIQTVTWAGDPQKIKTVDGNGEIRLTPRTSFAAWKQTVRHTALPWKACEFTAALELRNAIVNVALRHAAQMSKLNAELTRSNLDLDSFAYVASHDLKEPLRGIYNYSHFLLEDYENILDAEGVSKLKTLTRLTQRMQDLIDSLLHFSRLGRAELSWQSIDLNLLLWETTELFKITAGTGVEITVQPLPKISGDRTQLQELFTNLISNGIKYNKSSVKQIEIGVLAPDAAHRIQRKRPPQPSSAATHTIYVRDNGIGIDPIHQDDVFRIFKRLHTRNEYGDGTGAGLTIAQKIVERHGGQIWLDSSQEHGTTFYFTLPAAT
jgi:two-component system, chemotaxis family, sensor kinase Cph1